ncbi:MAG: lysophospholipid acyltransferase family protein [Bacteroidales bacterium]
MQKLTLQIIYSFALRWLLKLIIGVKFERPKFLLKEKQFIIVSNHNSHLDTMTLMASLPSKLIHKVKPVAAQDHFGKTRFQKKLSNYFINTLLIPRKRDSKNPENDPIKKMIQALDEGFSLILFPEGSRGKPEVEQPLQPGVGLVLSQRPDIKYVPAFMTGMGKAMPKGDNLIVPYTSSLIYGKPTQVRSTRAREIIEQIDTDFKELRHGNNNTAI